jgi:hypothetical protein
MLSSGCRKPYSATIAVQRTTSFSTVVYVERGGTLTFLDVIPPRGFKVTFPFGSPCAEQSLSSRNGSAIACEVTGSDGPYVYQVGSPESGQPPTLSVPGGQTSLAQIATCTNCTKKGGSKFKQTTTPPPTSPMPDQTAIIGCLVNNQNISAEVPDPLPPVSSNQLIEWDPAAPVPNDNAVDGATFDQTGPGGKSPCEGGSYGPFYKDNQCKIASDASSGTYHYTVNRSDCSKSSPTISLTVQ